MLHLDLPVRVGADGRLVCVPADGAKDIANSVGVLAATRVGERLSVPSYGTADPMFRAVDADAVRAAVAAWEPRADAVSLAVDAAPDGSVSVTLNAGG